MNVSISSITHNRRGMALLNVVFIFIFIGVLVAAGLKMYGAIVTRSKINDTKNGLENDVKMIVAWAEKNGRLPATQVEYAGVFGGTAPLDAWGRPIAYVFDDTLANTTNAAFGGLCGRTSTNLQDSTVPIAFALVSGGEDGSIQTTVNGTLVTTPIMAVIGAAPQNLAGYQTDLYRGVPLEELKSRAGCYGPTGGRLTILNNELPRACAGLPYNATVYAVGGVPINGSLYNWSIQNRPGWLTPNGYDSHYSGGLVSLQLGGNAPAVPGLYTVTFFAQDGMPNSVQRTYPINVVNCNANPDIDLTKPADAAAFSQNIVTDMGGIQVANNMIEFGFNATQGSACIWYPANFPLLGKTLRAFWNFCFNNPDTSSDSTSYADGYTFTLMQGSNPTTYCGTGTPWDSVLNPYYNCSDKPVTNFNNAAHFGEFLAYCGLPGQSTALEFDIYPNGNSSRNDPTNYNHVAVVQSINEHTVPISTGLYGENTHNFGGNPACGTTLKTCNGTCTGGPCTGMCDGTSPYNGTCNGTCYGTCNGTCNGTGSGCVYNGFNGDNFITPPGHTAVTWLEDGCNATKDNHNARLEVHTRCNSDCSQCETSSCTSKALIKVWIDKGNNSLGSDATSAPDLSYCADLPTALNQFKAGFTQATGASNQMGYISNFILKSYGSCSLPVISPTTLPAGTVGTPYAAQVTASGGQPPYTWGLSSSNISGVVASTLPPGLSTTLQTSGTCPGTIAPTCTNASPCICGTPTQAWTYNTVLVSATDSCTADTCANTASRSYTININQGSGNTFDNFVLTQNVFVYGTQFVFSGGNVNGPNATTVIKGNLDTSDLNGGAHVSVTTLYIDGHVYLDGGSASLGSSSNPGTIYVNGDATFWGGTRDIYGTVYVNGNFSLKDAHIHGDVYVNGNVTLGWTPTLDANSHIYFTGSLSTPGSYPTSITDKCVHISSFPSFSMPNYSIPPLKADSWYTSNGYVTGNPALANNIKIISNDYSSTSWVSDRSNVIIASKGNITITGMGGSALSGVLFAPYGKVTFDGGSFTGVVIARDGFFVTSGGTTVTFQNISNYINDPNNYPF